LYLQYENILFSIVDRLSREDLGIMPCVRTNKDVQSELKECVKDLYQKIIWNGKMLIND
jgi:hypothetical protein